MLNITQAVKQSVNDQEPPDYGSNHIDWYFGLVARRNEILLPWGYPGRDWQLRSLRYNPHNTLVVGAFGNIIRRFKQIDFELVGGRNLTKRYQKILQDAQYGLGYDTFMDMLLWDYFTLDNGAFIEIIGRGEPDTPLQGEVAGIAVLDSLRCYATGNQEFPAYYQSHITGKISKMHWSRVVRLVDQPSSDPQYKQRGLSAMSRAVSIAKIQTLMSEYQVERLGDLPPAGIISLSGINMGQWEGMYRDYQAKKMNAGNDVFANMMIASGIKPDTPVKVEVTPFSTLPEHFNWFQNMQIAVNLLALAIGDDPQEIWSLSGSSLGTATQSEVLHAKGQARIFGDLIKLFTRLWNLRILPESIELKYKPKDTQQSQAESEMAEKWSTVAQTNIYAGTLTRLEARQLLANTVPAFEDVLLDEAGQVRLPDDDVSEDEPEVIADDTTDTTPTETETQTTADDDTALETRAKDIQAVALDFEGDFEDMLQQAYAGNMTRSRAGIVARAIVGRAVDRAYKEGLKIGGVAPEDASDEDYRNINRLQVTQSVYITEMLNKLYKDETTTEGQLENKPTMWFNKSIYPAYDAGMYSADKNGYYEWSWGSTEEHCSDCRRLNGQVHRLRDWQSSNWKPKSDRLECKGFNCDCRLVRKTGARARGNF